MYTPLYNKTNYSLLSSLLTIDDLINLAKNKNLLSLGICDNNMFGTMEFINKCTTSNIHPVIGLEMNITNTIILGFAKNYEGYQNLLKLSTLMSKNPLTINDLKTYQNNIIFILPNAHVTTFNDFSIILNDLYAGYDSKDSLNEALLLTKKVVYLPLNLYLRKDDATYLSYLYLIRDGKTITDNIPFNDNNKALIDSFTISFYEDGINNTSIIAKECNISFPLRELMLPIYDCNGQDPSSYLKDLSIKGLRRRLKENVPLKYQERLFYELDVISKMGFANYFLVVYDFIKYAKKRGILVGPGRGSAAGSLVSYCLGITDVDPIVYNLFFERFLNPERVTMPDIDTDFPDLYRDEVIEYVKKKYGEKRVSGIVTFGTLSCRQVLRDTGRILNIPLRKIDNLCKEIPNNIGIRLQDVYNTHPIFKQMIDNDITLNDMYNIALHFEGMPRHTSVHAAGIVMCQKDLDEIIPLTYNNGMYLSSFTSDYLEDLGLLKMDFLGLKNLTTIMNIIKDIKKDTNEEIDFNQIPLDNTKAYKLFQEAKTTGIFQFESSGMRSFLRDLKPENLEDLIAAIALFRPGPAINIPLYIKRRHHLEEPTYPDPILKTVLESTYGIMIYQEQIMQTANLYAGYTLGESDLLRRAMSKKKVEILQKEEAKFLEKSALMGHDEEKSKELFSFILKFAGYGFNRSHSVCYSLIAYKMAYLKVTYPKAFYTSLLTSVVSSISKTYEYFIEAKGSGIKILLPTINESMDFYQMTKEGILFPLTNIKGVGEITSRDIIAARGNEKFSSLYSAISRLLKAKISRKTIENLIYAGCFEEFSYNKKTLINNLDNLWSYATLVQEIDETLIMKPELTIEEEYSKKELLEQELDIFGFYFNEHPASSYRDLYKDTKYINNLANYFNKNITIIGLISKIKEVKTKKGDMMAFIDISDESGNISITLFPKIYLCYHDILKGDVIKVEGVVERRNDRLQVIVSNIVILE